jgi:beta-lactamase regulating signal transducer with metallopeptidase domain
MNFLFIDNLFNSDLPGIVINVFLHSLWQGAVFCVLAWLCLKSAKKWSAQARYNMLVFFLFAFISSIVFTIFSQLTVKLNILSHSSSSTTLSNPFVSDNPGIFQKIILWSHANASWVLLAWSLIFMFKLNQMVRNLMAIERLKQFGTLNVLPPWKERFDELRISVGIKTNVILNESSIISQPLVVGVLKPLVLVPVGFLNGLSPKEVEAILLHELAHVRRNDYLVNLLQNFIETIFFFNPFVYWLSALIRNEREHCCDAIAIQHSGSKKIFLDALLSVQQLVQLPPYALGVLGI